MRSAGPELDRGVFLLAMRTALSVIGVIVFGIGSGICVGGSLLVIALGSQASPGVLAAWLIGSALFLLAGVRYVVQPARMGWGVRASASAALALGLILFHPVIFGLPGRIGETLFLMRIRTGMSADQVRALMTKTGGMEYGGDNGFIVHYADFEMVCFARGDAIHVTFDTNDNVRSWQVDEWSDGC